MEIIDAFLQANVPELLPQRSPTEALAYGSLVIYRELRTYVFGRREIDRQVHYRYDLASTRQSPVPDANKGVIVFAEPLTIYGNTVVVDHGLGLQTLYAHLSSTAVKVGDAVEKGQELARTGSTG